jgi:Domain of unknown function (DUF4148)
MKSIIQAAVIAAVLSVPVVSFAQSNAPLTRAQVRTELVQIEKAGYNPATADPNEYPENIQAAEARVAAQNGTVSSSFGGVVSGTSQSGPVHSADGMKPVFFGQ